MERVDQIGKPSQRDAVVFTVEILKSRVHLEDVGKRACTLQS